MRRGCHPEPATLPATDARHPSRSEGVTLGSLAFAFCFSVAGGGGGSWSFTMTEVTVRVVFFQMLPFHYVPLALGPGTILLSHYLRPSGPWAL